MGSPAAQCAGPDGEQPEGVRQGDRAVQHQEPTQVTQFFKVDIF